MLKILAVKLIKLYQKTLSPDHGYLRDRHPMGCCRFRPTCSQYAVEAIELNGFFVGVVMAAWRILRCNPFSRGGNDSPKKFNIPNIIRKI